MKNSFTILVVLISILFSGLLKSQTVEFTIPDKILHLAAEDSSANLGLPLMWGAFQVKTILACKVNSDAYEDLIIYAPGGKNLQAEIIGTVYIYFGSANGVSNNPTQIIDGLRVINDAAPYGQLIAGDFNNDGNNDLVVGYESYNRQNNFTQGYAVCFYGKADGSGIDTAQNLIIEGQSNHGGFTHTMEKGDINQDGIDDLLIGALHDGGNYEGRIYCYYGGSGFNATPDVTFSRNGSTVLGCTAIKIGDVNNDGFDDVLTSDIPNWNACAIKIDAFMGDNNMNTQPAYVQSLDGMLCLQVSDLNGDGYDDILGTNGNGMNCAGTAPYHFITVIKGSADYSLENPLLIPFEGQVAIPSNFSNSIDLNNDGINEVFLTITKDDRTKESCIIAGHPTQYINMTDTLYKFVDTDDSYGNTIENIIPADCNGDGKPEFYGYSQMAPYKNAIFVYENLPQEVLSLSIPDTLEIPYNGIALVPVILNNPDNIEIEAFDLIITYNPTVINISGITLTGGVLDGLNYVSQVNAGVPGQITIILYAGGNLFSGEGEIIYLSLTALSNIGECSSLNFTLADINEECVSTTSGQVCIIQTLFDVSGNVAYFGNSNPISDVLLTLTGDDNYSATTNFEGLYQYSSVLRGEYISTPSKINDLGGLSGTDASRIARYPAGLYALNCMEQIAADVSLNGSISGVDASRVARYSAGLITELNPEIKNWVFSTENVTNCELWPPIFWTDSLVYNDLHEDLINQDFTAIRLGDVTGNWTPDSKFKNEILNQVERTAGYNPSADSIQLLVSLDESFSIEGLDIILEYDASKLKFVKADFESSIFEDSNYEMQVNEGIGGKLRMVIYALGELYFGEGVLTKITFAVISETNKPARIALTNLSVNENRVKGWLALQNEPSGHQFKTEVLSIIPDAASSFIAVYPNPFQNKTCISYFLNEQSQVTIQITDLNGKLVATLANEVQNVGMKELTWNGDNDQKQQLPQGVYFAVFKSDNSFEVKRIVLIR